MCFRIRRSQRPSEDPSHGVTQPRIRLRPLKTSRYTIPGVGCVMCTLWLLSFEPPSDARPPTHALGMKGLGYRRLVILGRDGKRARAVHALLVRHTVTPCALRDVLEELP